MQKKERIKVLKTNIETQKNTRKLLEAKLEAKTKEIMFLNKQLKDSVNINNIESQSKN